MNVFAGKQVYGSSWRVTDSRSFSEEEVGMVKNAEVVDSEYGKSVCFHMFAGGSIYIPLSTESTLKAGDSVDVSKAQILTLSRDGNADIERIQA